MVHKREAGGAARFVDFDEERARACRVLCLIFPRLSFAALNDRQVQELKV